jgi:tetratricopeptide (TPR) repeat protein
MTSQGVDIALNPENPAPWFNRALVLIHLDTIEDAKTSYTHAKVLFEKNGNKLGMAATLFQMGTIVQNRDPSEAVKLFNESLRISRSINDKMQQAAVIHHLGMIEQTRNHYGEARRPYNESLRIKQELGDRSVMAVTLANLGQIELNEWDSDRKRTHLDAAERLYKESLDILNESGDAVGIANVLHQMYKVEYWKGNLPLAKKFYDQSEALKRELQEKQARIRKWHTGKEKIRQASDKVGPSSVCAHH